MVRSARSPASTATKPGAARSKTVGRAAKAAPKLSVARASAAKAGAKDAIKMPSETTATVASSRKPRAAAKTTAPQRAGATTKSSAAKLKPTAGKAASGAIPCAPVNLGFLAGFVGFHLRLAQDASYRAFARVKDKDLVKPGRFPALAIIHLNPGISQSALGRAIARDKSTVSPLIKDLQKNGFISRKPSPSDRRSVTLALTKKGERVLDRLHARALEHEEDLDKLVGASKSRLVGMLDKITGGLAVV